MGDRFFVLYKLFSGEWHIFETGEDLEDEFEIQWFSSKEAAIKCANEDLNIGDKFKVFGLFVNGENFTVGG